MLYKKRWRFFCSFSTTVVVQRSRSHWHGKGNAGGGHSHWHGRGDKHGLIHWCIVGRGALLPSLQSACSWMVLCKWTYTLIDVNAWWVNFFKSFYCVSLFILFKKHFYINFFYACLLPEFLIFYIPLQNENFSLTFGLLEHMNCDIFSSTIDHCHSQ